MKATCPKCDATFKMPASKRPRRATCGRCGKKFTLEPVDTPNAPLVLLEPGIHLVPCESDIVFQLRAVARRVTKGEGGVVRDLVADLHVPKDAFALETRMGRIVARLEPVHPHVFLREVVEWQMVGFTEQHHLFTISKELPIEIDAHPPRARLKLAAGRRNSKRIRHDCLFLRCFHDLARSAERKSVLSSCFMT